MRVLIVHPDLGVGGAERLILDIAIATKSNGHDVTILTNQYDQKHCFEDSKDLNIIIKFQWIPRQIFGLFHALLAYFKLMLASLWLIYFSGLKFDIICIDQISLPVAIFKLNKFKIMFYCHYPDQLLCVYDKKYNILKRLYRVPLDWLEMKTTGMADVILVNSEFTSKMFRNTFPNLKNNKLHVLYPSLNTEAFDAFLNKFKNEEIEIEIQNEIHSENINELKKSNEKKYLFVSINRYERKKDLKLAINAIQSLKNKLTADQWKQCHLVMAGGYDSRVNENVAHYNELRDLSSSLKLDDKISFMRSISDKQKVNLLRKAFCLIYTPTNEHFGIVPIEAMYASKPVIATNTGGPLETVANEVTGYLALPDSQSFANAMLKLIENTSIQQKFAHEARLRVINNFSFLAFKKNLGDIMKSLINIDKRKRSN
jgi:alpha-1,3/alpha-1,6-mannosyltransferase